MCLISLYLSNYSFHLYHSFVTACITWYIHDNCPLNIFILLLPLKLRQTIVYLYTIAVFYKLKFAFCTTLASTRHSWQGWLKILARCYQNLASFFVIYCSCKILIKNKIFVNQKSLSVTEIFEDVYKIFYLQYISSFTLLKKCFKILKYWNSRA